MICRLFATFILLSATIAGAAIPESVPVRISDGPHPRVFLTQEEAEHVRQRAAEYEWADALAANVIEQADALVAEELNIPHKEGQWSHWYTCEDDGGSLRAKSPTEHVCRTCGRVYTGQPYDGVYVTTRHNKWLGGVETLGIAYLMDPKPEYAQRTRDILVEYASFYNDLELHDIHDKQGTAKAKLFAQTLNEAVALCRLSLGYDLVHDDAAFSDEDHKAIELQLIRPMVEVIQANPRDISNWQTWHNAAVSAAGQLLQDEAMVDWAVNGKHGLLFQLREGSVMDSGMWYEESPSYHWYAFNAMIYQLESCKRAGMDFYDLPIIEGMFYAPIRQILPDGTFVPIHDSTRGEIDRESRFYEIAFREYKKPLYAAFAQPRDHNWGLIWGVDNLPGKAETPSMESSNDISEGLAVLRSPDNQTVLFMDYGPGRSAHVQNAKLGIILYAHDDIRFVDPGRLPYGNPMHNKWFRQTVAHNTVVVDEKSQRKTNGTLEAFATDKDFALVRASCSEAYRGIAMNRTLMMSGNVIVDVFQCSSETSHTYDLPLHFEATLQGLPAGESANPFGDNNGYGELKQVASLADGALEFTAATPNGDIHVQTFDRSQNYRAEGYATGTLAELLPMVIRRQQGENALFVAVYQILDKGEQPTPVEVDMEKMQFNIPGAQLRVTEDDTLVRRGDSDEWESVRSKHSAGRRVAFDFGSEDVAAGYIQADSSTQYNAERGYGWTGEGRLFNDVQHKPEALDADFNRHRDFTWSYDDASFRFDIEPGIYRLSLTTGDINIGEPVTKVHVNVPDVEFPTMIPAVREYITATAAFEVTESPLVITFTSDESKNWQVNELILEPAEAPQPVDIETAFIPFFDKAKAGEESRATTATVRVIAANLPPLDALGEKITPAAAQWDKYKSRLMSVPNIDTTGVTRDDYLDTVLQLLERNRVTTLRVKLPARDYAAFALAASIIATEGNRLEFMGHAVAAINMALADIASADPETITMTSRALANIAGRVDAKVVRQWVQKLPAGAVNAPETLASRAHLFYADYYYNVGSMSDYIPGLQSDFTAWGLYNNGETSPAGDLLARVWLSDMLNSGYIGPGAAALARDLRNGAYATLFLQESDGGLPEAREAGDDAMQIALFEMNAMYNAAKAEKEVVGIFKRAAHRAYQTAVREEAAPHAEQLRLAAYLALAYQYAKYSESFYEQPSPAEFYDQSITFDQAVEGGITETAPEKLSLLQPSVIKSQMKRVYNYAVENPRLAQHHGWEKSAFHIGVMEAFLATRDEEYLNKVKRWADEANYEFFMDRRGQWDADNQACGQVFLDLYKLEGGEEKTEHVRQVLDAMAENAPKGREHWWWCDALFMAPPVFAKLSNVTGDAKYNDLMSELWFDAKEFLYDENEHLFYRDYRYFDARTESGKKVFWSRGNGWVLAGLARVLSEMPEDHPRREDFLAIYNEMATKITSLQGRDGMWRTSLVDHADYPMPETSGTAFFIYALAWGINNGIIEGDEYTYAVENGWNALNETIFENGRIGWVQHVAGAPGMVAPEMTREYAPGAFLLAGSEMLRFAENIPEEIPDEGL